MLQAWCLDSWPMLPIWTGRQPHATSKFDWDWFQFSVATDRDCYPLSLSVYKHMWLNLSQTLSYWRLWSPFLQHRTNWKSIKLRAKQLVHYQVACFVHHIHHHRHHHHHQTFFKSTIYILTIENASNNYSQLSCWRYLIPNPNVNLSVDQSHKAGVINSTLSLKKVTYSFFLLLRSKTTQRFYAENLSRKRKRPSVTQKTFLEEIVSELRYRVRPRYRNGVFSIGPVKR